MKRKKRAMLLFLLLSYSTFGLYAAAQSTATFTDSIAGEQTPVEIVSPLGLTLAANGGLPGDLTVTIDQNNTHTIVGGTWKLVVTESGNAAGTLEGTFSGGSVDFDDNGRATSIRAADMTITGGTGKYADQTTGSGRLEGTFFFAASTTFTGTLSLSF